MDTLALRLRLAGALERASGLAPVEVVVLDEVPLSLAGRVRENGQLLYSRDEVARVRYESRIGRTFHDFRIHEERAAAERLARLAEGR